MLLNKNLVKILRIRAEQKVETEKSLKEEKANRQWTNKIEKICYFVRVSEIKITKMVISSAWYGHFQYYRIVWTWISQLILQLFRDLYWITLVFQANLIYDYCAAFIALFRERFFYRSVSNRSSWLWYSLLRGIYVLEYLQQRKKRSILNVFVSM